jgi:hypothetical protein
MIPPAFIINIHALYNQIEVNSNMIEALGGMATSKLKGARHGYLPRAFRILFGCDSGYRPGAPVPKMR